MIQTLFAAFMLLGTDLPLAENRPTAVSLDYCADQYLLLLGDTDQINAVSREAASRYSHFRTRAESLPKTQGTISELLFTQPRFIIQSYSATPRMRQMLAGQKVTVIDLTYGSDQATTELNIRAVAEALDQTAKADALIQSLRRTARAFDEKSRSQLFAAYITPSGYTSGGSTFVNAIIEAAGFQSYGKKLGLTGWQPMPMEAMVMDPPDVVITSFFDSNQDNQSNWSLARHPFIARLMASRPQIDLPGSTLACSGLFFTDAVTAIRAQAVQQGLFEEGGE